MPIRSSIISKKTCNSHGIHLLENVIAAGGYLASESIVLTAGGHTIAFEIQDTNGNFAKVTRTVTIAGDSVITLGGHNDSGEKPDCGSVYYVDICAVDLTEINKITAELKLQTANTWELQRIAAADGFKTTYSLNETEQRADSYHHDRKKR